MQRPDEPKPAAANSERFTCWACGWDSLWPGAGGGCYCCLGERLRRGAAPRVVTDEDDGRADGPEVP
jgi:hypothetical protein